MKNLSLRTKLLLIFLLIGLAPLGIIATLALQNSTASLTTQAFAQLLSMREVKKNQIDAYFERVVNDITLLAGSEDVRKINRLLTLYAIDEEIGPQDNFNIDTYEYQEIWQENGANLLNYVNIFGYADVYIISKDVGHVIYSAKSASDLGINLSLESNQTNPLSTLWRKVIEQDSIQFQDFMPYSPLENRPVAFMGAPVKDLEGTIQAVVVIQISIDAINNIMLQRNGMGATGETYLVGPDFLMRSDSFPDPERRSVINSFANPATGSVNRVAITAGLQKQPDSKVIFDYNNNKVLSAYTWVQVGDLVWALVAEIDAAEAFAPVSRLSNIVWLTLGLSTAIILLLALSFSLSLTRPVIRLSNSLQQVADDGNYSIRIPMDSKDEIGQCASAFNRLISSSETAVTEITKVMEKLAKGDFSHRIEADFKGDLLSIKVATNSSLVNVQKLEDERKIIEKNAQQVSEENARVRQALDNVSTNTLIADNEYKIIYINHAANKMLKDAEEDISRHIPNFRSTAIIGQSIDMFHQHPAHQRQLLDKLTTGHYSEIKMANKHFGLAANPILDNKGNRLGIVVELTDRTAELAIEKEIDNVIEYAAKGDFSRRLTLEDKAGFFLNLSSGLNTLTTTIEDALADMQRILGAMARGDLTARITQNYQGRLSILKEDTNSTIEKLTQVIRDIRVNAQTISFSSNEITAGNRDLSKRTESQASSLQATAASMDEMTATVKHSAENAMVANALSAEASAKAQVGGDVVNRSIAAMNEITNASDKIADIISVIDAIAFQTNLLALNAAVEAARAGEQGRGFAVVASEVRNLAQRSASAAKEIKGLIRNSNSKVASGAALVTETGSTLKEIVLMVEQVREKMSDISIAAQQQSIGIEQVNASICRMDDMTQQNAALVQEGTTASETLLSQAEDLTQMVEFFLLNEHTEPNRSRR
ncbi:MAG: methyl-accepting chemotaxis protein [Shewanella sp.]